MIERLRILLAGSLLAVPALAFARQPAPPATDPATKEIVAREQDLSRQFREFTKAMLTLAQNYEKSERIEDKDKAKTLRKVIDFIEKDAVENKFSNLLRLMGKTGDPTINELQQAIGENQELARSLREILTLLLSDDELAKIKAEKEMLQKFLDQLKGVLRDQKTVRAMTETDKASKEKLAKDQKELAKKTDQLAKDMGATPPKAGEPKPGEPKKGDLKPGEPKKGEGTPGSGPPKPPSDGQPKPGQPTNAPPKPKAPGADQVQKAVPDQNEAQKKIEEEKKPEAGEEQTKAIEKLQKAQEELEKRLKQLREEEMKRVLAALEARCNKMLAMQIEVYENTKAIQAIVSKNADRKPTKAEFQKSQQQSDKEADIVGEADKVIEILRVEGSSVAFPDVFEEVRRDMVSVKERLQRGVTDDRTQLIEEDIIAALKEIIAALKKQQQEGGGAGKPGEGGPPQDQKLLNKLAELKLIRSLQVRVNERTKSYSKKFEGEQADDEILRKDLKDLAEKQDKIHTMTDNLDKKKNN